tara:strand:- start:35 stop:1135 length:1101 start_codon:yes stop_codon:yes gene_type:complete
MPLSKIQTTNNQVVPNLGRRNIIINGAMQVAQRGTSNTGLGASGGYFNLDRFRLGPSGTAGRLTMSQSTVTDLPGFANALKLDCTTADTSIAAGEIFRVQTTLEGQDLQLLAKGTSSAKKITVSFYVKGNASATYMVELYDNDNNRNNTQQFAVTSSWNRISLTFAGDTTGAFDNDNALSLYLNFWIHAGSTYSGGSYVANTWASPTNANRAAGISSFFDSTNRTLEITGLQMEAGDTATPFEHRSFNEELRLCQRYFWILNDKGATSDSLAAWGRAESNTEIIWWVPFPVEMRAVPTIAVNGSASDVYANSVVNLGTYSGQSLLWPNQHRSSLQWTGVSGVNNNYSYDMVFTNSRTWNVEWRAEL